jgi:hypothetical protein
MANDELAKKSDDLAAKITCLSVTTINQQFFTNLQEEKNS